MTRDEATRDGARREALSARLPSKRRNGYSRFEAVRRRRCARGRRRRRTSRDDGPFKGVEPFSRRRELTRRHSGRRRLEVQSAARGQRRPAAPSDPREDARLIDRIVDGDRRAFETLYRLYHPRLTRFLINMIHRPQLVEEVLDDTLMVVWNRPDSYNGASKVSTWIFAIAYRKALNALRRHTDPIEDKHAETRQSAEAGPEQQIGQRQVHEVLLTAMGELSADHRAVVDLTYFHDI